MKWSCVARVRWNELGLEPQRGKLKKKLKNHPFGTWPASSPVKQEETPASYC